MTSYYCDHLNFPTVCCSVLTQKRGKMQTQSRWAQWLDLCSCFWQQPPAFCIAFDDFFPTHCSILAWSGSLPWAQMVPRGGNLATVLDSAGSHSCNVQHSGFRRNQLPDNMESEDLEAIWFHILRLLHCSKTCVSDQLPLPPPDQLRPPCILSRFSSCVFFHLSVHTTDKKFEMPNTEISSAGQCFNKAACVRPSNSPLPRIS